MTCLKNDDVFFEPHIEQSCCGLRTRDVIIKTSSRISCANHQSIYHSWYVKLAIYTFCTLTYHYEVDVDCTI